MERRYIAFDTWPGCGFGCVALVAAMVTGVGVWLLLPGTSTWWLLAASFPPAVILTTVAFRVDRRSRKPGLANPRPADRTPGSR